MAVQGQEADILGEGIRADSPSKGSFALNMLLRRGGWEVRRGFGQLTELDTTMGAIFENQSTKEWGYKSHLGSYLMRTSFGNDQIISAFSSAVFTGDRRSEEGDLENASLSKFMPIYVVSIYDVTTGERWEEPIFRHTADFGSAASVFEMPKWRGHYESYWELKWTTGAAVFTYLAPTSNVTDRQQWIQASAVDKPFFFQELHDILYLGNSDTGLLAYSPCTFRGRRRGFNQLSRRSRLKQLDTADERHWHSPYSESSVIINAVATGGPFADAYTYFDRTSFPSPSGASALLGRLVLFEGNTVYFSDQGFPTSIAAPNFITVPSEDPITAIQEYLGNVIIFTRNETWYFQPGAGFVISGGRLVKLAQSVGCIGESAITRMGDGIAWVGEKGIYSMEGALSIRRISDAIEPLFNDFISNPLTNFFVTDGELTQPTVPDQASSYISIAGQVVCSYSARLEALLVSVPSTKAAFCYTGGQWSLWSFESMVNDLDPASSVVGMSQNIQTPWIMSDDNNIFLVTSEPQGRAGQLLTAPSPADTTTSRSYSILQYGRGGALDRSVERFEDYRNVVGRWRSVDEGAGLPNHNDHYLYIGKPIPVPLGQALGPPGAQALPTGAVDGTVWVPFDLVTGDRDGSGTALFDAPQSLSIVFTFDDSRWGPVNSPAGAIRFFLPPERQPTIPAWTVVQAPANTITITFTGAGGSWYHAPNLNLSKRHRNRLIYIPFKPNFDVNVGMGISIPTKTMDDGRGAIEMRAFVWEETFLGSGQRMENSVAQAVDWAYKSSPVKDAAGSQIKGRGVYADVLNHGAAVPDQRLQENWPFGIFNVISGVDNKSWSSQVVDSIPSATSSKTAAVELSQKGDAIRTRYAKSSASALTTGTYNNTATGPGGSIGPFYGTEGSPEAPNYPYIVSDEQISQIAVSDSARGESVTYMIWGHLQNKAERLVIGSAKIVMRILGGKRRRGR